MSLLCHCCHSSLWRHMQGDLHDSLFLKWHSVKVKLSYACVSKSAYPPILNWSTSFRRLIYASCQISNLSCFLLWIYTASSYTFSHLIVWYTLPYIFTSNGCQHVPHSSSLSHVSLVHALPGKSKTTSTLWVCVCVYTPASWCLSLLVCAGVTKGDSEQWSWLKSGPAAVVYVLLGLCRWLVDWFFWVCMCVFTLWWWQLRELGCTVLCSILMPLSLLGLVPFPQPSLGSTKRVRIKEETGHPYTGDN